MKKATPPIGRGGGKSGKEWVIDKELQRVDCGELHVHPTGKRKIGIDSGDAGSNLSQMICPTKDYMYEVPLSSAGE